MSTITAKQAAVLAFIRQYIGAAGYPPTRTEISQHFGWRSINSADTHVQALCNKGMLEIIPGIARGIRIVTPKVNMNDVLTLLKQLADGYATEFGPGAPGGMVDRARTILRAVGEV